eukprot:TRINITY_DN12452_c0_g1_i1.p1 TRINITY_DN12452_c0_g1~~TRINITY_DN12452_c0_g1_i1.p1  ORF type:complete len:342 (-),score=53.95 TRINITY_DN12452_c0_g1_i1:51-1076(-)
MCIRDRWNSSPGAPRRHSRWDCGWDTHLGHNPNNPSRARGPSPPADRPAGPKPRSFKPKAGRTKPSKSPSRAHQSRHTWQEGDGRYVRRHITASPDWREKAGGKPNEGWIVPQHIMGGMVDQKHLPSTIKKTLDTHPKREEGAHSPSACSQAADGSATQTLHQIRRKSKRRPMDKTAWGSFISFESTADSFQDTQASLLQDTRASLLKTSRTWDHTTFDPTLENTTTTIASDEQTPSKIPPHMDSLCLPRRPAKQLLMQRPFGEPGVRAGVVKPQASYIVAHKYALSESQKLSTYQRMHNTSTAGFKAKRGKAKPWSQRDPGPVGSWTQWGQVYRNDLVYF